jgi:flagellin-like hook-associated protein FlgL
MTTDITLTKAQRTSLLSLQNTQSLSARTQRRLSTGLKVSSPSDGAVEFFRAKTLSDRAADYQSYKDNLDQGVSHVQLTLDTITEIDKLLKQIKGILEASRQQNQGQRALATTTINNIGRQIREYVEDATFNGNNFINNTNSRLEVRFGTRTNSKLQIDGYNLANASVTVDNRDFSIFSFNVFSTGLGDGTNTTQALKALTTDLNPITLKAAVDGGSATREQIADHEAQGMIRFAITAAKDYYNAGAVTAPVVGTAVANARMNRAFMQVGGAASTEYLILRLARTFISQAELGERPDHATDVSRWGASAVAAPSRVTASATAGSETDAFTTIQSIRGKTRALQLVDNYMGALSTDKSLMQGTKAAAWTRLSAALTAAAAGGGVADGTDSAFIVALGNVEGRSALGYNAGHNIIKGRVQNLSATQLQRLIRETVGLYGSGDAQDQQLVSRLQEYAYSVKGLEAKSQYFVATAGILTAYSLTAIGSNNANLSVAENAIKRVDSAIDRLRGHAQAFGSHLLTLKSRIDFTSKYINIHTVASESLTTADLNEEASNLVSLQTSQQLGLQSLAIAAQMQRAILALLQSS